MPVYAVFDKSTSSLIAGPFAGTNFWKGFGAPCETNNDGDIIIQWDQGNHRWLAAQNVFNRPPFFTCVAVSQTADATGSCFRTRLSTTAWLPRLSEVGPDAQRLPVPERLRCHDPESEPFFRSECLRL